MKILNDKEDFFNRNHTRNEGNTHYADYNCGGWALKTFSWFVPYRSASDRYDYLYCFYDEKNLMYQLEDQFLWEDVEYMLNTFDNLRIIDCLEEVDNSATVIAYRVGVFEEEDEEEWGYDFHFRVRRNGRWTEKCGAGRIREVSEDQIFEDWFNSIEDFCYSSDLILFELKE